MSDTDPTLVYRVEKAMHGSNVHMLRTLLFLYGKSKPRSQDRARYEKLLRDFVSDTTIGVQEQSRMLVARSEVLRVRATSLFAKSKTLNDEMARLRRQYRQE